MGWDVNKIKKNIKNGRKYFVHFTGEGEGCGVIGCHELLISLKAKTLEEAKEEITQYLIDNCFNEADDEVAMESAVIIECANVEEFDIEDYYVGRRAAAAEEERMENEDAERAELTRLQKKYAD